MRGAFVPGKLRAYLDAQYAPLSDVIQACVVGHSNQLVRRKSGNILSENRFPTCDAPTAARDVSKVVQLLLLCIVVLSFAFRGHSPT